MGIEVGDGEEAVVTGPATARDEGVHVRVRIGRGSKGPITAKGLRHSGDIVVCLEAPDLEATPPAAPARMDQKNLRFVPHVLPIVRGTSVRFYNSDFEPHNVYSREGRYSLGTCRGGAGIELTMQR